MKSSAKQNLPPGTLVYTGRHHHVTPEMTMIAFSAERYVKQHIESIEAIQQFDGVKWFNLTGLSDLETIRKIGDFYGIDPMILEDIVHVEQRTKIEISENYLFGVFKMIYTRTDMQEVVQENDYHFNHEHISFLLMPSLLITFQEEPGDVFDGVRERLADENGRIRTRGADYLFYALVDALVDHQMEAMLTLQNDIDSLEASIVEDEIGKMEPLYHLRKSLLILKSGAMPLQETLTRLIAQDTALLSPMTRTYFKDVIDHAAHLSDRIMMYREVVTSLFDMHQTNVSNRMNRVMTTLTFFSAIFIPLSFLAGFFGMNFEVFPSLHYPYAVPVFIGSCVGIALLMLGFFKWKDWF
jgi:magnesium transporter